MTSTLPSGSDNPWFRAASRLWLPNGTLIKDSAGTCLLGLSKVKVAKVRQGGLKVIFDNAAHEILAQIHVIDEARQRCEYDSLSTAFGSLEGLMISPRRTLPGLAALGIAIGFLIPAAPASATTYDYCWTVFRTSPIYSTAGGRTQVGTAYTGDTFQNIHSIVQGSWRYGDDEQNGVYGWIGNGNLTNGHPCE